MRPKSTSGFVASIGHSVFIGIQSFWILDFIYLPVFFSLTLVEWGRRHDGHCGHEVDSKSIELHRGVIAFGCVCVGGTLKLWSVTLLFFRNNEGWSFCL